MPRGNGTGPNGAGPMTGRAAGYCAGYSTPGFANPIAGGFGGRGGRGGFGVRGGGGRGWRNMYYATGLPGWARYGTAYGAVPFGGGIAGSPVTVTPEQELAALKNQARYFDDALKNINKRIDELENQK